MELNLILLIIAAVLLFVASIRAVQTPLHLGWLGAFFFVLSQLLS
jgi:hypothetical protein